MFDLNSDQLPSDYGDADNVVSFRDAQAGAAARISPPSPGAQPASPGVAGGVPNQDYGLLGTGAMKPGDTGPRVMALQKALMDKGFDLPEATGTFDFNTTLAVRKYQEQAGYEVTGEVTGKLFREITGRTPVKDAVQQAQDWVSQTFVPSVASAPPVRASETRADQTSQQHRRQALMYAGVGAAVLVAAAAGVYLLVRNR